MANNERLTKRVKKIEDWVAENEEMGGPKGYLDTMVALYNNSSMLSQQLGGMQQQFNQMRAFAFEFIQQHELTEEWNEFLQEKENAVQEQSPEEVPSLTEAEDGEEVGKEDTKGKKPSKKSNKEKKD